MIIERYISREILGRLSGVCAVLVAIFTGYSASRLLADAVNGLIPGKTVALLILLKVVIAFEVLMPVTLYLAVILALGRFYADSEVTALRAAGIGEGRIIGTVALFALLLAVLVAALSLFARPWAYDQSYRLETRARAQIHFDNIEAGRFYELGRDLVFFAGSVDQELDRASNVYIWEMNDTGRRVTFAREAMQGVVPESGGRRLVLRDGRHYRLTGSGSRGRSITFQTYVLDLQAPVDIPREYERKAATTAHLATSGDPEDIAELQWRLSTGLSTVLLALLGIPLSRTAPRQGKYANLTVAIILFFVYYNLGAVAKNWVEQGTVPPVPGIWWSHSLLAAAVLLLLLPGGLRNQFRARRAAFRRWPPPAQDDQ